MNPIYPLFVFEKDDSSMLQIERFERILYHLETIDIENGEYLFWDATGAALCLEVKKLKVSNISPCESSFSLAQAFARYAERYQLPHAALEGTPIEIWSNIQSALGN